MEIDFINNAPVGGSFNINMYHRLDNPEGRPALVSTPGLSIFKDFSQVGEHIRLLYGTRAYPSQSYERLYCIADDEVQYIQSGGSWASRSTIPAGSSRCHGVIADTAANRYFVFVDGVNSDIYWVKNDDNVATTSVSFIPYNVAYQDGYVIASDKDSNTLWHSSLSDPETWPAGNTGTSIGWPDQTKGILSIDRELWVINRESVEILTFDDTGDFRFSRIQGGFKKIGCDQEMSIVEFDNSVFFLSDKLQMVRTVGYEIVPISTPQLDGLFQEYEQDGHGSCRVSTVIWKGHPWLICTWPDANVSWCYDLLLAKAQMPAWFQLSTDGIANKWTHGGCSAMFEGDALVGDPSDAIIYKLDDDVYTDNGTTITSQRTAMPIKANGKRLFFSNFELDCKKNVGGATLVVSSTVAVAASVGDTTITLASATNFADTQPVTVALDDGTTQQTYISGAPVGNVITLEDALVDGAAIGKTVTAYTPATDYPRVELFKSDDDGTTWDSLGKRKMGQSGGTKPKMRWASCGSTDKTRQFRIKIPHAVEKRIYGASVDIGSGR